MATVTAFLKHSHIGKQKQAEPYTAAAHARYIMRKNAVQLVYSEGMPKQYHAVQRFLQEHEDRLRKNGRVLDKFIISIPHDVSQEDAVKALRLFGHRLGHGKAPFLFAIHGFDTRNHHAHFLFIDRDPETGRRVFGTSEKNSTSSIKIEWETAANEMFDRLGYDVRVKVHEGYQEETANDNHFGDITEMVHAPLSTDNHVRYEPAVDKIEAIEPVSEDNMADPSLDRAHEADISTAAHHIRLMSESARERNLLNEAKAQIDQAQQRYDFLVSERERAKQDAFKYVMEEAQPVLWKAELAQEQLRFYQKDNGKLKGIGVKLFGFELKTAARKQAEMALAEAEIKKSAAISVQRTMRDYDHHVEKLSNEASAAEREAFMRRNELIERYGEGEELKATEKLFDKGIRDNLEPVIPEEAWEAFEADELTIEEIHEYCIQSGNRELLTKLEDYLEYERRDYAEDPTEDGGQTL